MRNSIKYIRTFVPVAVLVVGLAACDSTKVTQGDLLEESSSLVTLLQEQVTLTDDQINALSELETGQRDGGWSTTIALQDILNNDQKAKLIAAGSSAKQAVRSSSSDKALQGTRKPRRNRAMSRLDLSDKQRAQTKELKEQMRGEIKALREDGEWSKADKESAKKIAAEFKEKFETILTDDQRAQVEEMKATFRERSERGEGRMHNRRSRARVLDIPGMTDDQRERLSTIRSDAKERFDAFKTDNLDVESRKELGLEFRRQIAAEIEAVFTPEQRELITLRKGLASLRHAQLSKNR